VRRNPGYLMALAELCKGGAGLLHRPCRARIDAVLTQGFGRFAASALGCAATRFQRWWVYPGCSQFICYRPLARISHQISAAADPGMSTALRSVGFRRRTVKYACGIRPSLALYPCRSAPPRYEIP